MERRVKGHPGTLYCSAYDSEDDDDDSAMSVVEEGEEESTRCK